MKLAFRSVSHEAFFNTTKKRTGILVAGFIFLSLVTTIFGLLPLEERRLVTEDEGQTEVAMPRKDVKFDFGNVDDGLSSDNPSGIALSSSLNQWSSLDEDSACDNDASTVARLEPFMSGDIPIPPSWGEGRLVSGDVVELDDGRFLRRAIISADNRNGLILSIEIFDENHQLTDHGYFDGERVKVRTDGRYHRSVLNFLKDNCHREVIGETFLGNSGGVIWVDAPSHASGMFGFVSHLKKTTGYPIQVELIELASE